MSDKKPLINFSEAESDSCDDEPAFHSQSHHTEYVASDVSDSMELSALIGHDSNSLLEHSVMDRAIGMVSECESGSRENAAYFESAYSNSQHRMGIEPEHNSKEYRMGIEPEHNNLEHRIGTEPEYNNKEHRMGIELEQNTPELKMNAELEQNRPELKMNAELEHNTPEHIIGYEPAHNSPEHKMGTEHLHNSTEHKLSTEHVHNSTEHKMSTSLVHNSIDHKMSTEPMHNSPEQRLDSEWKSSTENLICFEAVDISTEHRINTDFKHEIKQQKMNTESEPQITEHKMDIRFVFKREEYGLSQESQPYTKDSEMPAVHDLDSTEHRVALEDNNKKLVGTGQMHTNYDRDIDSVSFSTQHGFTQPDHGILPPSWSNDPHNSCAQVHGQEDESVLCVEENSHEQSHNLSHQSAFGNTQTSCEIQNVDISQRPNSSTAILDTVESLQACKSFDVIENGQRLNPASLELIYADNQSAAKSDADNVSSALSETMLSYDHSAPSESSSSFNQFDDEFMDNLLGKLDSPQPDSWLQEPKSSDAEMPEVPEDEKCPSVFIVSMCEDHLSEQLFQERNEPCMDRCLEEKVEDKDERERSFSSAENRVFQDAQKLDNDQLSVITNKEYQKVLELYNLAPNNDNRAEANDFDHSSDLLREDSFSSFQQVQNIDYDVLLITEKESNGSYEMSELSGENTILKPVSGPFDQSETISHKFTATNMFGLDETSTDDQLNFFFEDDDATSEIEQDSDMSGLSDLSASYARNINQSLSEQLAVQGQESDEGLKKGERTAEIYTSSNSSTASLTMNSHHPEKYFVEKNENYDSKPENCLNKIAENFELEENVCGDDYSHKLKENSFVQHKDDKAETVSKSNHCGFVDKMQEKKSAENSKIMDDFSLIHLSDMPSGEDNKEKTQNTTAFDDLSLFELPSESQGKIYNEVSSEKSKERGDLLIDLSEEPQGETDMKENCKNTDTNPNCAMPTSRLNEAERISLNNSVAPKMIGFAEAFNKPEYETNVVTEFAAIGSTMKSNTTEDDGDDNDNEDDDEDQEYRKSQTISGINDGKSNASPRLKLKLEQVSGSSEDMVAREATRLLTETSCKLNLGQTTDFLNKNNETVNISKPDVFPDCMYPSQMPQHPAFRINPTYCETNGHAQNEKPQPSNSHLLTSGTGNIHADNNNSHLSLQSTVCTDEQNEFESPVNLLDRSGTNSDCAHCLYQSCSSAEDTGYQLSSDNNAKFGSSISSNDELSELESCPSSLSRQSFNNPCSQCLAQSCSPADNTDCQFSPGHISEFGFSISSNKKMNESSCNPFPTQSLNSTSASYQSCSSAKCTDKFCTDCNSDDGKVCHPQQQVFAKQSGRQLCRGTVQIDDDEKSESGRSHEFRNSVKDHHGREVDPAFSSHCNDEAPLKEAQLRPYGDVISSVAVSSQDSELREIETSYKTSGPGSQRMNSHHHITTAGGLVGDQQQQGQRTDISVEKRARTDTQGGKETSMHQQQKKESEMHHETDQEQKECSRTVRVHGLTADDEYLCKLYFENKKRSGGGVIEGDDITWDAESKCFILTFEDSAVARNVVSRKHSFKEKVIEVETWNPPLYYNDSVLLSGVPVGTTEDLIQNFLESIADINVASVQLDKPNGKALVALEHGPIDVAMLRQLCQENKLNDNVELSVHNVPVSDIVLVQNIKPETNTECIKFFFMNKMRNKGGPVNNVQRMDKTTAFVYFKNPQDAAAVVDKRNHILDGSPLQVTPHIVGFSFLNRSSTNEASPTAPASHETFVSRDNINNPMTGSESLEVKQTDRDYLKQSQHETRKPPGFTAPPPAQYYDQQLQNEYSKEDHTLNPKNFGLMKEKNCTFSVKFKGTKVAKQMNQSEVLHDFHQNSSEYPSPSCERQNLTDTGYTTCQKNSDRNDQKESHSSSKEQFLHEKVCTNHRLQTKSTYHKRDSRNFVPGHDEESNSCQNERNSSQHHTMQRNFQGQYNTPTAAIKATHMFYIKEYIADEIMDDTQLKKDLVAVLKTVNCKYIWNKNHNGILVTCNEDVPPPGWIQEVEKVLDKFILKISVKIGEGMVPVEQLQQSPISHQMLKFPDRSLTRIHYDQQVPQVAHINTASQQVSHVPGDKEKSSYQHELYEGSAFSVSDRYTVGPENTPHTVCSSEDRLLQIPSKSPAASLPFSESSINLKPHQIKYLSNPKVMLKLKAQYPNVVIYVDETASKLKLKAPENFETTTKLDILSLITKVSKKSVPLTPAQIAMYGKKDTHDYVNKILEVQEMICLWETSDSHFLVYALEDDHFRLSKFFSTFFKEEYFSVSEKQSSLLKTKEWDTLHTILQQPGSDCPAPFINIDIQNKSIIIVGLPENVEKTKQLLKEFFCKMKTEEKNISISTNHHKFLTHCNKERLKGMIDKARKAGVTLSLNNGAFVAEGPSNDVSRVQTFVKTVLSSIDFQKKTFTGPGVAKYFLSPTGQDWLQRTGQDMHCLITTVSDQNAVSGSQVLASCLLGTQVQLDIVQGDITQCDVGAIVNAANNELSHGGGVAGAIVSAGGESIQEECTQIVKDRGNVPDGSVVVSNPGTLQCSYILHAVGPVWKGGNKGEEKVLMETIQNILKEAERMKLTTLAMPAISCGIFNYPPNSATLAILRTIKEHFENGASESCLRSIVLIDTNADPLKAFISSAKQLFGKKVEVKAEPQETNAGIFKNIVSSSKQFFSTKDESSAGPRETTHREHRWEGVGKPWAGSPTSHSKHPGDKKSSLPIRIIPGEIAKSRTDVIVCTVHPSLDLKKGVLSRNILDEGGKRIQEELQKVFASRGPVQAGKVIKTSGGDLQCKNLFHISLPSWKEDDRGQVLKSAVHECLDSAQKVRAKSLAFPALGTGKLGYPSDEAAKIMFTTISKWFHENQDTCLREVQIIVYSKDKDVLQAFKQAEQHGGRQHQGSNSDRTERRRTQADISGPLRTQVGKLRVIVKQGNILSESCEAIVNSSNDSLDLSKGAVSKAIREACGDDIIVQCSKQKGNMEDTGIAMTGVPAGSLACGNIIHISADRFKRDWHLGVLKVLQTADTNHLQSVALPALGTGGRSANPKQLAQSMQQAVVEFADEARSVKEIRIVIFQPELLSHYCTAFDSSSVPAGAEAAAQSDEEVQETENKPWKDVEVYVYSDKKDAIGEAFDKVSAHIKQNITSKEEKDTLISKFDKQQRSEVLFLQTMHDVEIQLDEKGSRVKITGFEIDVANASSDLKTIMFKASKQRHLAAGMPPVRWQYEVGSNKYKDFDPEQTLEIEAAFKKKEHSVIFSDKKGNRYKIVFKEKLEYSLNDTDSNPVKVRRRDILHEKSQELPLPSHWTPMKKDEKVKLVNLDPSSNEYKRVAQHFGGVSDLMGGLGNVPHLRSQAGTLKIERIQNPTLFQAFKIKKSELEKFNTNTKENEQRLWHGTDSNNIQGIITNGFNRSYCGRNGTAYGDGVYFAVNSSTSMGYARGRQMFQARVLVGESTPGRSGMRTPPQKPGSDRLYDSLSGPGMFIIFHDSQAYPEYLLTF